MKLLSVRLGVILIELIIFGHTELWAEDWKSYGGSDNYLGYYDAQSITRPSKDIVRVWKRYDYTEKGVLDCVEKVGKKCENLTYSKELMEINCVEKMSRFLSVTLYDNKGGVIEYIGSPSDWKSINPESMGESLYKEVCK